MLLICTSSFADFKNAPLAVWHLPCFLCGKGLEATKIIVVFKVNTLQCFSDMRTIHIWYKMYLDVCDAYGANAYRHHQWLNPNLRYRVDYIRDGFACKTLPLTTVNFMDQKSFIFVELRESRSIIFSPWYMTASSVVLHSGMENSSIFCLIDVLSTKHRFCGIFQSTFFKSTNKTSVFFSDDVFLE